MQLDSACAPRAVGSNEHRVIPVAIEEHDVEPVVAQPLRQRAPSLVQLYDTATGNPNLKMECATMAEAGLSWKFGAA